MEKLYSEIRKEMKDGDILLFRGNGVLGKLIKWRRKSAYSHAGIVSWWKKRLVVIEAVGKGIIVSPLSKEVKKYDGGIDYFRPTDDISKEKRKEMIHIAQLQLGKEYDVWGLLKLSWKMLWNKPLENNFDEKTIPSKFFCSEFVAFLYEKIGHDLLPNEDILNSSPEFLAKTKSLEKIATLKK
jgi:hypothetical protein